MTYGRVVAVEASPEVLDAARDHIDDEWSDPRVRVELSRVDIPADTASLRDTLGRPADLVWASAAVHHVGDQQAAVTALAGLLGPGGRLALAEGGLPEQHLPWDVGLGEPGLEGRLHAAQDRWFAQMRAALPGSRRMPYGWTEALRRAGLSPVTTCSTLRERPPPLNDVDRGMVLVNLAHRVGWLRPTGLVATADLEAWDRLLDPADEHWLGRRADLFRLSVRSVHFGVLSAVPPDPTRTSDVEPACGWTAVSSDQAGSSPPAGSALSFCCISSRLPAGSVRRSSQGAESSRPGRSASPAAPPIPSC
ncbi:class I SAM-dependent methyltransferase [Micromonospora sp. LOL_015]|uniref:class I SAM-dependent methyltransferase n=1 Tax=Micromonospora sp. LOL_015 TaxID=3345416 RepID=UPI003A843757